MMCSGNLIEQVRVYIYTTYTLTYSGMNTVGSETVFLHFYFLKHCAGSLGIPKIYQSIGVMESQFWWLLQVTLEYIGELENWNT